MPCTQFHNPINVYRFADVPTITLHVGPTKTSFHVHKTILCDASPFFRAAFNSASDFKEALEQSTNLPEDDIDTIERFLSWLYTRKFGLQEGETHSDWEVRYLQLAKLYVLADKLGVSALKNYIVDKIFELKKSLKAVPPQHATISYVYANSLEGSALRKLLVDWHVWHIDMKWYHH